MSDQFALDILFTVGCLSAALVLLPTTRMRLANRVRLADRFSAWRTRRRLVRLTRRANNISVCR